MVFSKNYAVPPLLFLLDHENPTPSQDVLSLSSPQNLGQSRENPGRNYIPPPMPPISGHMVRQFSGEGAGCVYVEAPPPAGILFYAPPPPALEGYFQGWGGVVLYKCLPRIDQEFQLKSLGVYSSL